MKLTAKDLLANGVIEKIIPEPEEGLENNLKFTTDILREDLYDELTNLCAKTTEELLEERYERFRKFGEFNN